LEWEQERMSPPKTLRAGEIGGEGKPNQRGQKEEIAQKGTTLGELGSNWNLLGCDVRGTKTGKKKTFGEWMKGVEQREVNAMRGVYHNRKVGTKGKQHA